MDRDPWHYPRTELARRTLAPLANRLASALSLFAPRRSGKTQFLLHDLGPHAEGAGHRVIYANFWRTRLSPLATLLHALEASRRGGALWDRIRSTATRLEPRITLSGTVPGTAVGATTEVDLGNLQGPPPSDLLLYLGDLLGRLGEDSKPVLLMLDDVQELATDASNQPLVASLRTALDTHRGRLATVFTGSSQDALRQMFAAREAPFFHFATPVELPDLDDGFVRHVIGAFRGATGRSLDRGATQAAFEQLHRNPFFFRRMLETLLLDPALDVAGGLDRVRTRIANDLGYAERWVALAPLQRAIAGALADGETQPYSAKARAALRRELGPDGEDVKVPTSSQVQSALRALVVQELADRNSGQWAISDAEFAAWIRSRSRPA